MTYVASYGSLTRLSAGIFRARSIVYVVVGAVSILIDAARLSPTPELLPILIFGIIILLELWIAVSLERPQGLDGEIVFGRKEVYDRYERMLRDSKSFFFHSSAAALGEDDAVRLAASGSWSLKLKGRGYRLRRALTDDERRVSQVAYNRHALAYSAGARQKGKVECKRLDVGNLEFAVADFDSGGESEERAMSVLLDGEGNPRVAIYMDSVLHQRSAGAIQALRTRFEDLWK